MYTCFHILYTVLEYKICQSVCALFYPQDRINYRRGYGTDDTMWNYSIRR